MDEGWKWALSADFAKAFAAEADIAARDVVVSRFLCTLSLGSFWEEHD